MKKINFLMLTIVLLVAVMDGVQAQRPVGDTLMGPGMDTSYYPDVYDWLPTADTRSWRTSLDDKLYYFNGGYIQGAGFCPYKGPDFNGNLKEGNQFFTDHPLKVVGAAACGRAMNVYYQHFEYYCDTYATYLAIIDTTLAGRNTDSLILYTFSEDGNPKYLTGGPWRVENPHRHMNLPRRQQSTFAPGSYAGDSDSVWRYELPVLADLYEVIFDEPVVVRDSFIVAGTANNNELVDMIVPCPNGSGQSGPRLCLWEHRPTRYWSVFAWADEAEPHMIPWFRLRNDAWERNALLSNYQRLNGYYGRYFYVIIPIIDPDTTWCDEVWDLHLADSTDTTLTLMWTGGNNDEWEVQYMEVNGWDVWTVTTRVPMVTLTGLRERTNYLVRVRGRCEWDTEFGHWTEWADVFTGVHHDDPVGISNLGRFTQMMPNPASGQVTVLSSYRLSRVVVYDLAGHAVLELEDDGLSTTFDVGGLAKGVYVVAIHTPAGIATKRLVIK